MNYLNVRLKTIKLLEENKGVYLHDFGISKTFLYLTPKAQMTEEKINCLTSKLKMVVLQRIPPGK